MPRDRVKRWTDSANYSRLVLKKKKKELEYLELCKKMFGYEVSPGNKINGGIRIKKATIIAPPLIRNIFKRKRNKTPDKRIDVLETEVKKLSVFTKVVTQLPPSPLLMAGFAGLTSKIKQSRNIINKKEEKEPEISFKELDNIKLNLIISLKELEYLENDILKEYDFYINDNRVKKVLQQINDMKRNIQEKQIDIQDEYEEEYEKENELSGKAR